LQIKQIEAQVQSLEEEKAFMEGLIAKLADEKDELASKVDGADVEIEEAQTSKIELEKELEETQLRLQVQFCLIDYVTLLLQHLPFFYLYLCGFPCVFICCFASV
jgi:predicted  nucleic acid-binding Zn-ribbon protein